MNDKQHDDQVLVLQQMYGDLYQEHGARPEGVGWSSGEAQIARFDALTRWHPHLHVQTVLDVGCGYGRFAHSLIHARPYPRPSYTGIDILPEYIVAAKQKYGQYGSFHCRTAKAHADKWGENSYDVVVGCGTVGWWADPFALMTDMWYMARKCLAFNWYEGTSVLNMAKVLAFCTSVGCESWTIQHDYHPKDYTIHMYKQPNTAATMAPPMKELVSA